MGRPKGSKNKRSVGIPADLQAQLGQRDPAEVLGEIYSMPHDQLKRLVRSAAGARAMALRMQAAVAAMPYRHSKMPVAVTVEADRLPVLVINAGRHQMIENKVKSDTTINVIGNGVSDETKQTIDVKGQSNE